MAAMNHVTRWLALGVLPFLTVAGLTTLSPGQAPEVQVASSARCSQPPVFTRGYQRGQDYVIPRGNGFLFRSDAWIETQLCHGGTLSITAQGELAGQELPQLTVVLNSEIIATPRFDRERTAQVRVPAAGRLILGYFNDYYEADVRVATLRGFKLKGTDCEGFTSITVPREAGGTWSAQTLYATLVRAVPMTVVPCGHGTLSVVLVGRPGNGAYPEVTVSQGGRTLARVRTAAHPQSLSVDVQAQPLTITVTNPYFKTIGDRNLLVSGLTFSPDESR